MRRLAALASVLALTALAAGCAMQRATQNEPQLRAATDPKELRALRADLVETYVRAGAVDLAAPLVREALQDEPRNPRLITLLGAVLLDRGLTVQANEQARAAISIDERFAPAYVLLGRVEQRRGRREDAILAHQRATELAGDCSRCWNNLGYSLFLAGRDRDAVAAYERALKIDPNARTIYNNLGFAYGRLGDDAAALRAFRQAVNEKDAQLNLEVARGLRDPARAQSLPPQEKP